MEEYNDDIKIAVQDAVEYLDESRLSDVALFLESVAEGILDLDTTVLYQVANAIRDVEDGV